MSAGILDIHARGLTKSFTGFVAVRNIDLEITRGTIFGFFGPNGAGKSTTVKMLTGLLRPTSGDALIAGHSIVTQPTEVKRGIGVLPEDMALFQYLTIWDHLIIAGSIYGLTAIETEVRTEQLLKYLDLWETRHTYVNQCSYGMGKKCSLAMALIHNPRVLFLDEPFEGIDPVSSRNIKDLLVLLAQKGVTTFLTSHILEVVERLVQSFAIITHGEIACTKTMAEVMASTDSLEEVYFRYVHRDAVEPLQWMG